MRAPKCVRSYARDTRMYNAPAPDTHNAPDTHLTHMYAHNVGVYYAPAPHTYNTPVLHELLANHNILE